MSRSGHRSIYVLPWVKLSLATGQQPMADPVIPDLASLPILQWGITIVTIGTAFAVWWRGTMRQLNGSSDPKRSGTLFFFDGPLNAALHSLEGLYRIFNEMKGENERTVAEFRERHERELEILRGIRASKDDQTDVLKDIRDSLKQIMTINMQRQRR